MIKIIRESSRELKAKRFFSDRNYGRFIKTFAILTGENPNKKKLTRNQNRELNKKNIKNVLAYDKSKLPEKDREEVERVIGGRTYPYYKVKGSYDNVEHSFIIYNIPLEDAKSMSSHAGRQSFIFGKNDGEKIEFEFWANASKKEGEYRYVMTDSRDLWLDATDFEDYYTQIARDFKINIPFEKFEVSQGSLVEFLDGRCNEEAEYNEDFDYYLSESMNTEYSPKYRNVCRIRLYGNAYKKFLGSNGGDNQ